MLILNAYGLVPNARSKEPIWKPRFLKEFIDDHKQFIPVIMLTETHLKTYHSDKQVEIPNYQFLEVTGTFGRKVG